MTGRLAFVDDPSRLREVPAGYDLVAVGPAVELAAEEASLAFIRPEEHTDWAAVEADAAATFDLLEAWCATLDTELAAAAGDAWPGSTRWHFRALKAVVDGLRARSLLAEGVVGDLGAGEALLLLRSGSLALSALSAALPAFGVRVRAEPGGWPGVQAPGTPGVRGRPSLRRLLPRRRSRGASVACTDWLYGVPSVASALGERGAEARLLALAGRPVAPPALVLARLAAASGLFRVRDVDLLAAALPRLETVLGENLARSTGVFVAAGAELLRLRPDALFGSRFEPSVAKAAAAAARDAGVPIVVSRHGELGTRDVRISVYQDLDTVDAALCWGRWEAAFVARHAPRPVRAIVVGSPSLESEAARVLSRSDTRARLRIPESEVVALYVPTNLNSEEWFVSRNAPTDADLVRHQRAVVSALQGLDGITPLVKAHQLHDPSLEAAWAPCRILLEPPFGELVHLADAVLLDFPSTTLVQALRGSARVYVVEHPLLAWEPGVREHLSEHGVVFAAPGELSQRLRDDAAAGRLGQVTYAPEALEPLLASGPGTAAERAAEAILHIVSEQPVTTLDAR